MTKVEYAKKRIMEILIEFPEETAKEIVTNLAEEYEVIDTQDDLY